MKWTKEVMDNLADVITTKIRDELSGLRIVSFGEVKATKKLSNGGWTAEVLVPGAETTTNPLNCLRSYIPQIGDWVVVLYPPGSQPVLMDATPMVENTISTPDDLYLDETNLSDYYTKTEIDNNYYDITETYSKTESDEKYAASTHDHDGRYYTKTQSDAAYAAVDHDHTPGAWQSVTMQNNWIEETVDDTPGYYVDAVGMVHLKGVIKHGTMEAAAFTLPAGVRPARKLTRGTISSDENIISRLYIQSTGEVIPFKGGSEWFSLDGISFRAEQ